MDMISQLPEALLVKILCSLPTTKEVVATSVLSKQWRSLWKMVPNLKFICNRGNHLEGFSDSVRRTMLSLETPCLQSLHLDVSLGQDESIDDIGELVGIACGLHVRDLVLELFNPVLKKYPIILDNCQSLETLRLRGDFGSIALGVPSPLCLKSLRTLHLLDVFYQDDESVVNLFAGCVRLENLLVIRSGHDGVETFTIAVPSLQELTIDDDVYGDSGYVINSPSLQKLKIKVVEGKTIASELIMINAPELVEATIWTHDEFQLGESLTSVKRLSLRVNSLMEVPAGSIFKQLEYLQLLTDYLLSWNPLMVILDNSPNLQVLEIIGEHDAELTWEQPTHVPQCLCHLKTLDWYVTGSTYGKEVAKYILSNARRLENVVLRIAGCEIEFPWDFPKEERLEVCHDMEGWCPDGCKFELIVAPFDRDCFFRPSYYGS
ncbi:unnamed protein product [Eruca vesicaria subsp. sativa]|uniref:F-box domain-containing protein n=1 Tax=Eruca vesicaria subsp. sativa TaxID=29727 RepID=A0ABC8LJT5_ERUVS|nr:unnamed protein product [Eruca vesicaria subsp. sativa]